MKRKEGLYWVVESIANPLNKVEWAIAFWNEKEQAWRFIGNENNYKEDDPYLYHIGPMVIESRMVYKWMSGRMLREGITLQDGKRLPFIVHHTEPNGIVLVCWPEHISKGILDTVKQVQETQTMTDAEAEVFRRHMEDTAVNNLPIPFPPEE